MTPALSVERVKKELQKLRQGPGLAHPGTVLALSEEVRRRIADAGDLDGDTASEIVRTVAALRRAIESLGRHERLYAQVDFNLASDHSYPTLTERQESLACLLGCVSKTVRRHSDEALETLALLIVTNDRTALAAGLDDGVGFPASADGQSPIGTSPSSWQEELRRFWGLSPHARVDIVCSEIPEDQRPSFASPQDRNYLRYAKFADLDTLIYVRTRLTQAFPSVAIRDFCPSEYYDTDAEELVVIGGPPWNAKYREFLPQLPFYFEPHPLGDDDPLVVPQLRNVKLGPRWTDAGDLLEDLAVFTRLTLTQGTTVFLLGGCLTLGVLGAAKCFLQGARGAGNARYVTDLVTERDFVLVTEARRIGGIPDMADLALVNPLLLMARDSEGQFKIILDNAARYRP